MQKDTLSEDIEPDAFPNSVNFKKTHDVIRIVQDLKQGLGYMDLAGKFPYQSGRGNNYIMIVYSYDANGILVEPLKNRNAETIVQGWTNIHERLRRPSAGPNLYIMDNECSNELKAAFGEVKVDYQLVPPASHRANAAERAIRTFKNHFKACLASVNPDFPIKQWDRLLEQGEITLNLMRSARANNKLSAYSYLFGIFDYNKTPLVPPGTKVLVHTKRENRKSW